MSRVFALDTFDVDSPRPSLIRLGMRDNDEDQAVEFLMDLDQADRLARLLAHTVQAREETVK